MKLMTFAISFIALLVFSSCEKTLEVDLEKDRLELSETIFFFEANVKDDNSKRGYGFELSLDQISAKSSFSITWENSDDYYSIELLPGTNKAKFLKYFNGKECLETTDFVFLQRKNSYKLEVNENVQGEVIIVLDNKELFRNTSDFFSPTLGSYSSNGDLRVSNFKIY